jgi:hypothetical protein
MALAGAASSVADPNANVKLLLFNDKIREHALGPRIGKLVARLPQWSSFFGPTGIDPIRDIDVLYVAGPQLRVSADVVAVVQHKLGETAMRRAIDAIVQREPKGEWIESKVPAARARADRAKRTFVMARSDTLLMVPAHLTQEALEKAPLLAIPRIASDAAFIAVVATPWRAFIGLALPVQIPESIKTATIKITPAPDGGLLIQLDAADESPEMAARNAELLTRAINFATQRDLGALGALLLGGDKLQLLEPVQLHAKGSTITGTARATPRQVDRILNFAESWLDAREHRPDSKPSPSAMPGLPSVRPNATLRPPGGSTERSPRTPN